MIKKFLQIAVFFVVPMVIPVYAQGNVWITEIHYNPQGSDTGNEWIEIFNGGDETIDVTTYKLRENEVNHGIKADGVSTLLEPGQYAVIADKSVNFRTKHGSYTGILFDSAFSLKNSGEKLSVIDPEGTITFEVTYDGDTGGNDNGHSIGLLGDRWSEVYASPGGINTKVPRQEPIEETTDEEVHDTTNQADTTDIITKPTVATANVPATYIEIKNPDYETKLIKVDAGGNRTVMAGVEYWFRGEVYGLEGGILEDPVVRWNWGDGSVGAGNPDSHRYLYPGVYTATMSSVSGNYSARDMVTITVIDPALVVENVAIDSQTLIIANTSPYNLEISGYELVVDEQVFVFPPDSFIAAMGTLVIAPEYSNLVYTTNSEIVLQDSTGYVIDNTVVSKIVVSQLEKQISQRATPVNVEDAIVTSPVQAPTPHYETTVDGGSTHSVVYLAPENSDAIDSMSSDTLNENVVIVDTQQASIQNSLPKEKRYWIEIGIFILIILGGLGAYITKRILREKSRPIYDVID